MPQHIGTFLVNLVKEVVIHGIWILGLHKILFTSNVCGMGWYYTGKTWTERLHPLSVEVELTFGLQI